MRASSPWCTQKSCGSRKPLMDSRQPDLLVSKQFPGSDRPWLAICGPAIFLSAFLLFSLEPLIAKVILPWFGGSAAVWSTCLVFYQVALLAGYLYAELLTRYVPVAVQGML